jgi:hypothetical protein
MVDLGFSVRTFDAILTVTRTIGQLLWEKRKEDSTLSV